MAIMIPNEIAPEIKSNAEKRIFNWFQSAFGTDDWIVLHSLGISTHQRVIHGEIDFLVLAPGLGMFALEVKGGRVQRQLGKWSFINRYGDRVEKIRGPFDQAWEGIYSVKKSIANKLDSEHQHLKNILFGIGVMFPDIEYNSIGIDEEKWQVFDYDDGIRVKDFVERISHRALETRKRLGYSCDCNEILPTQSDIEYMVGLLRGDFDAEVPLKIKQKYTEAGLLTLTNEQALCIEQLEDNPRALIRGCAGTGKTLLAIEAARKAVVNGEKVAVFCYNKSLGEWLKKHFLEFPEYQRPLFVGGFHSYIYTCLLSYGIDVEESKDGCFFSDFLPLNFISCIGNNLQKFDRIIVDEAQDLISDPYLDVFDLILKDGLAKGCWTMFGDFSMQAIYSNGMTEQEYLDVLQERAFYAIFRLKKNCRNTKKICTEINNILGVPMHAAFETVSDVPAVNYYTYSDKNDQKEKLFELINNLLNNSIDSSDIVVLSSKALQKSVVGSLKGISITSYTVEDINHIRFSTIQGFKGLESSTIILTDVDSYTDEKLIYIGFTRARFALYVLESQKAYGERLNLIKRRLFDV